MNIFLCIVFVLCCGFTCAAVDEIDLEQQVIVENAPSEQIIHTLRDFFGAEHVEVCSVAEMQEYGPCVAVFFRDLERREFWSLVDQDRLQGELRTVFNNLMILQSQQYQTLFNHPNCRMVLMHLRIAGGSSEGEIFAGKMAMRGQSFLVSEEPLSYSEIYDLGEDLKPISVKKSILYFRVGLLIFIGGMIFIGLHAHGII